MNSSLQSTKLILLFLAVLITLQTARAQPSAPVTIDAHARLSAEQVVARMVRKNLERSEALEAYRATRIYRLEYHGFPGSRTAEMIVDVKYHSPATKEFSIRSQKGSQLLIDRVFLRMIESEKEAVTEDYQRRIALNNDNYRFAMAGYEATPTGPSYILSVEPRTNDKLLYRGRIWVNAEDFAVARIEAAPAKNPSFWTKETKIEQVYMKVGDFWLPVSNRSNSAIRLGGRANFSIDYQDYEITAATAVGTSQSAAGSR
jgi:hypothetical protein